MRHSLGGRLIALVGCGSPEEQVARRESPWWEDAARLELVEGIDLVEVASAAPVGYWPRAVVRPGGVSLDDRAFWLALAPGERPEAWVDLPDAAPLVDGRIAGGDGLRFDALLGPLGALREAVAATAPDRFPPLVIVADGAIPGPTLTAVLFTAGQAGWSDFALGVASHGRLRNAWVRDRSCRAPAAVALAPGAALAGSVPVTPADGACPAPAPQVLEALSALADRCAPIWDRASPGRSECFGVVVSFGDGPVRDALPALSAFAALPGAQPAAFGLSTPAACAGATPPARLSDDDLAAACGFAAVRRDRAADDRLLELLGVPP